MSKKLIFKDLRVKYEERGMAVTPIREKKKPYLDDWPNVVAADHIDAPGIGLVTGERSGVIALDVDRDFLVPIVLQHFTSPFGKFGSKGITLFFKYNGEKNKKFKREDNKTYIEVLSTGNQTVLPPSPHPDTKKEYIWRGYSLIDHDLDDMPNLPENYLSTLESIVASIDIDTAHSGGSPSAKGTEESTGRANKFVDICRAAFEGVKNDWEIAQELLDYDNKHHASPYFSDKEEFPKSASDPLRNAFVFVVNNKKTSSKSISKPAPAIKISFNEIITTEERSSYKEYKFPEFRGAAQEIFLNCYNNSVIPRSRFSIAATLAVMGGILGNKISLKRNRSNFYLLIVGESTNGKGFPTNYANRFFNSHPELESISGIAAGSSAGFIEGMPNHCTRVDTQDEAKTTFDMAGDKNPFNSGLSLLMSTAYTSAGGIFEIPRTVKRKETKILCPCISWIGGMNIKDFQRGASWEMVQQGFIGRLMFFPDTEFKQKNRKLSDSFSVPKEIINWAVSMRRLTNNNQDNDLLKGRDDCHNLIISDSLLAQINKIDDEWHLKASRDSDTAPAVNRFSEILYKMIMLDHASINWDVKPSAMVKIPVSEDTVDWSIKWTDAYLKNTEIFLSDNISKSKYRNFLEDLGTFIKSKKTPGASLSEALKSSAARRHNVFSKDMKIAIQNLIESEMVFESRVPTKGRTKTVFIHRAYVVQE